MITWVGEDTHSERLSSITNGVFASQFFNTGFVLLLVNANFQGVEPQFISNNFRGPFYDYMPLWYRDIGQKIVLTMLINSIMPYIDLVVAFIKPKVF